METIGIVGLILSLILLVVLVFKGYHVLPVTLLTSVVVLVFNQYNVWNGLTEGYMPALTGFIGNFLIMFILGSILGELLSKSGAATSIALKLAQIFGKDRSLLIVVLSSTLLSYGGVSVFVIIFSIYPIALVLYQGANLPKRLIPGAILLGAGSYTMTTLPGSPALTNIIPTKYLGTTTTAAPTIGIITAIVMFLSGYFIQLHYQKKLVSRGETFVPGPKDILFDIDGEESQKLPSFGLSLIPILLVIILILGLRFWGGDIDPVYSVIIALSVGCLCILLLFWNRIEEKKESLSIASQGGIQAILNTSSVVGFGGAIKLVPAFQAFVTAALSIALPPLISVAISVNIIASITASSSAGITIFMESMASHYLELGVNPQVLHRIAAISAGVLDSLPHAGPNVTFLNVTGLSFKEGYLGIFISTCIVPFIGLICAIILASLGLV